MDIVQLRLEARYSIRTTMRQMLSEFKRVNAAQHMQDHVVLLLKENEEQLRNKLQEIENRDKNYKSDPEWIYIKKELQDL